MSTITLPDMAEIIHRDPEIIVKDRMINIEWYLGTSEWGGNADLGRPGEPRRDLLTLTILHHGKAEYIGPMEYCYTASVSREGEVDRGNGIISRHYSIGRGFGRILTEEAKRFNAKRQREFADKAIVRLREIIDDPSFLSAEEFARLEYVFTGEE